MAALFTPKTNSVKSSETYLYQQKVQFKQKEKEKEKEKEKQK